MTVHQVHLKVLDGEAASCGAHLAGMAGTDDVDEVTCEDCLVAAIRDAGPVAVQAYVLRLGEISLQKHHPSIYAEMEGLGQVSKVNAEIRAELAAARGLQPGDHLVISGSPKVGKSPMMSTSGLSLPNRLPDEVVARLAGFVFRHLENEGDFEGRECALQRGGGWAIIREARAIGLMAKGFCALDHKIPDHKIRELGGYVDPPTRDLKCTCGAVEVSEVAQHLRPCPLSFERGDCPRCGVPIVLASFTELGFYEPDVDVDNDPVVWRHAYSGYGACGDMMGFASDPDVQEPLTYAGSKPGRETPYDRSGEKDGVRDMFDGSVGPVAPKKEYGHDREGYQCAPEICGGTRLDPCTYSPEEIVRFEAEEEGEGTDWERAVDKHYMPGEDRPTVTTGEPVRSVRGMHPRLIEVDEAEDFGRGTASKPVIILGPRSGDERATMITYERVDHAHDGNGVCVKNRFDKRCLADPGHGKSIAGMCPSPDSPDEAHWWDKIGDGEQSTEYFACRWCATKLTD